MGGLITFLKGNGFKFLVLVSICIIFYYTIDGKIVNRWSVENPQSNHCSGINSNQYQQSQGEDWNKEGVLAGKPLPVNALVNEGKTNLPVISNVRLAEVKNDEQTIVMEDNSWQTGTDIILAVKGVRAKWVFRFKDGKACNGKISIERFGMILPVVEKEMVMTFAPWKDFSVSCDKGKFNYYIKVVDNLNTALNTSTTQAKSTPKPSTDSNVKPSTKSSSVSSASTKQSTTNANTQIKPKENESKSAYEPIKPTNTPEPSPNSSLSGKQEPAANNGDISKPQEKPKKGGILDHLFHH